MSRRGFLKRAGAGAAALSLGGLAPSCIADRGQGGIRAAGKPNIVFIVADDMGWADLSCYGNRAVATPRIDGLARGGVRFTDAYSGCTVCAPARSCLMTGHHMGHASVRLNTGGVPLRDEDRTVAEVLKEAGYATGGFGKWGLGDLDTTGVPERQGFDVFYGYYHQIHAHYYLPGYLVRNGAKIALPGNEGFYGQYPHMKYSGGFPRVDPSTGRRRQFTADLILEETLRFIRERARSGRPFFCYAPWTPPHGEYLMPDDDPAWQRFAGREDWPVRARVTAAYNVLLDRHVGALLDCLDELGIAEKTIVFFASDNGADSDYDGALDSCGPLRGRKRSMYEGGIRVPLVARWPGRIPAGAVSNHVCTFADVMPTLAEAAGAAPPAEIDGISFLPELLQKGGQRKHDYVYWEWERYDWGRRRLAPGGLMQGVRRGRWKAVRHKTDDPIELYDLGSDIGERQDLAAANPEVVARMARIMTEAREPMRPQEEPAQEKGRSYR